jgi:phage/plasmid-like protein (TIGR03299 family)
MAHQLTIRADGFAEMAFAGDLPWHGLGQALDANADMETWRKAAGMDWTIESTPVVYAPFNHEGDALTFPERFVQYRSDTKAPLSVVSSRYKPVQPSQVLDFFNDLVQEHGFKLHTAGTLFGGKRLWALAETGKYGEVGKEDGVGGFLLLSTSCDKTLATTARFTTVRVVCNNTLSMAVKEGQAISFTHLSQWDSEKMRDKIAEQVESFGAFMEMAKHLKQQKCDVAAAQNFMKQILFTPKELETLEPASIEKYRPYKRIMELFNGEAKGWELDGVRGTRWGLLNSITEYLDHHSPARSDDARLNSAWFGTGDTLKTKAVDLLIA